MLLAVAGRHGMTEIDSEPGLARLEVWLGNTRGGVMRHDPTSERCFNCRDLKGCKTQCIRLTRMQQPWVL